MLPPAAALNVTTVFQLIVQTLNIITKMSHNPKKMKSQPVKHFIHLG
jgi:hypothetical protein